MSIADFGSGSGIFTIEMAKRLNPGSHILAIDVLEKPLMFLFENAKRNNVAHIITTKVCDLENKTLGSSFQESFDIVTIINVLFQIKNKGGIIKEVRRVLKTNGFLVVVD
ncbi:MAG TPA: class I SAM-dependent methyltransferase [Candidatus Paceibacterota bacterium]|jgi:2-polyprenyl-3-methyl-5-hydroxy-6-metoxy-1,4-benzoquinol methylase|nr:class I SAM-dependent methyltransferase [Candidatus Paceibacterota bacterium]HRZ29243.1 class I SAM-dependent methyltransferase [Candidatus Paceibacterota bacterium]